MNPPKISILLLRTCLFAFFLGLLGLAIYGSFTLFKGLSNGVIFEKPGYVVLMVAYIDLIPLLTSIFHGFRILNAFAKDFDSASSISSSLNIIKNSFLVIAVLAACILPVFFYIGQADDAPGVVLLGITIVIFPLAISAVFRCLQYVLKKMHSFVR